MTERVEIPDVPRGRPGPWTPLTTSAIGEEVVFKFDTDGDREWNVVKVRQATKRYEKKYGHKYKLERLTDEALGKYAIVVTRTA